MGNVCVHHEHCHRLLRGEHVDGASVLEGLCRIVSAARVERGEDAAGSTAAAVGRTGLLGNSINGKMESD